jgi:hypothetical protein
MVALLPDEAQRAEVTAVVQRRFGAGAMGRNLVIGTAPELVEYFRGMHGRGVERFYVWFADFAPVPTLERFAAVIGKLRMAGATGRGSR